MRGLAAGVTIITSRDASGRPSGMAATAVIAASMDPPSMLIAVNRTASTEAAVDLAKLAGLSTSGVICEVANDDGTMARLLDLETFAERHGLHLVTIEDLIAYRSAGISQPTAEPTLAFERTIHSTASTKLARWFPRASGKISKVYGEQLRL
nr:3,4-dihydroxy-2-butanone-4-phosphate synthase [Rhizobium tibeticum]